MRIACRIQRLGAGLLLAALVMAATAGCSSGGGASSTAGTGSAASASTSASAATAPTNAASNASVLTPSAAAPTVGGDAGAVSGGATAAPAASDAVPAAPTVSAPPPARRLNVVATTTHIQDFVRNVAGDRVNLLPILKPGADAHDYQPTAEDARSLAQADIVFYNGVQFEPWLEDLVSNVPSGAPVVNLAESAGLAIRQGGEEHDEGEAHAEEGDEHQEGEPSEEGEDHEEGDEHEEGEVHADEGEEGHDRAAGDPHVWQDPTNVQKMVTVIAETLAAADAPGAAFYRDNATRYNLELAALDQEILGQIGAIPAEQRKLVTNHDAFGYYIQRYGLTFVGAVIPGLSTEAEPSAADVQALIEQIQAQGVRAIFTESNVNPRLEQQIAEQAGVKVYSTLYGDALG